MKKYSILCLSLLICGTLLLSLTGCKKKSDKSSNAKAQISDSSDIDTFSSLSDDEDSSFAADNSSIVDSTDKPITTTTDKSVVTSKPVVTTKPAVTDPPAVTTATMTQTVDKTNPLTSFKGGKFLTDVFYSSSDTSGDYNRVQRIYLHFDGNECITGWEEYADLDSLSDNNYITYNGKKYYFNATGGGEAFTVSLSNTNITMQGECQVQFKLESDGNIVVTSCSIDMNDYKVGNIYKKQS